jgi:hypothetical protein
VVKTQDQSMLNLSSKIPASLLEELAHALEMIKAYGSIELYVQDSVVTQITVRNIKKTKVEINRAIKKASDQIRHH